MKAIQHAVRDRDTSRLREAAHKVTGMLATFSSEAGSVASALEDRAEKGQIDEARPLAARLDALAAELMQLANGLSLDALCDQAATNRETQPRTAPDERGEK
jgi:hypothetical protein